MKGGIAIIEEKDELDAHILHVMYHYYTDPPCCTYLHFKKLIALKTD